ncbi:hypothetical protein VJI72_07955, partial [Parvimonas micra]|uniref:hypothetical protein n=1 Tax=Parvimonas micra TaxID=33033 RepID=UPI002B467644
LLAHHIMEEPERFKALFERISGDMSVFPTVIIDNSLVELGEAVALDMVRDAAAIIKNACPVAEVVVVLPDVMGDGEGTRQALQKDAENWINAITCDGFMIVLQGKDDEDFDKTLK